MNRWGGSHVAPKLRRRRCKHCGAEVDAFTTEYGRPVQLDTTPAPITTDLPAQRRRLWEHRGPGVGWCQPFLPRRTWRELRLEHECATPEREHKSKRKHNQGEQS